jgi:hypothetical protein
VRFQQSLISFLHKRCRSLASLGASMYVVRNRYATTRDRHATEKEHP